MTRKFAEASDEIKRYVNDLDRQTVVDIVKEIGKGDTEYIKASEISKDLDTEYIGKSLYVYKEVRSTNTIAKFLSINDCEDGAVVISEKQTDAKGRSGKSWASPLGGIWLSVILKPILDHSKLPLITLATGVAVA